MTPAQCLGGVMVSLPILVGLYLVAQTCGWRAVMFVCGFTLISMALVVGGAFLLAGGGR